jgi:hypothetical protein
MTVHLNVDGRAACRPKRLWGRRSKAQLTRSFTEVTCPACPKSDAFKIAAMISDDNVHFRVNGAPGCGADAGRSTGIVGNVMCAVCRELPEYKAVAQPRDCCRQYAMGLPFCNDCPATVKVK